MDDSPLDAANKFIYQILFPGHAVEGGTRIANEVKDDEDSDMLSGWDDEEEYVSSDEANEVKDDEDSDMRDDEEEYVSSDEAIVGRPRKRKRTQEASDTIDTRDPKRTRQASDIQRSSDDFMDTSSQ